MGAIARNAETNPPMFCGEAAATELIQANSQAALCLFRHHEYKMLRLAKEQHDYLLKRYCMQIPSYKIDRRLAQAFEALKRN